MLSINRFDLIQIGVVLFVLIGSGCAHFKHAKDHKIQTPTSSSEVSGASLSNSIENQKLEPVNGVIGGVKLVNTQFDIPIALNSQVEFWIDYFRTRGRKVFTKYLERSEYFIPYITPLLKQNGLPEDLVYLAMIESGFSNHARSRAAAVGPWQFISATGKRFGLMINWWIDERRDTRKSTLAAVEYLRDLYKMFQSWELAAAAYNAGEQKVARAIQRYHTKDFWQLARHRFLKRETRDYVPKIMAAAIIAKNRTLFGFPEESVKPKADEVITGDGQVVKVEKEGEGETITSVIQANLREDYDDYEDTPEPNPGELLPASLNIAENESQPLAKPIPTPHVSKKGEVSGQELMEFEIQSPADLLMVARAAGLSYHTIKSVNPEVLRWCTPPTMKSYRVRLPASVKDKFLTNYNHNAFPKQVRFLTYKVRRGENLSRVARHFGIKVDPIADLNSVSPKARLRTGVRVLLPMPIDRSRTLASLEVKDPPTKHRQRYHRHKKRSATQQQRMQQRLTTS